MSSILAWVPSWGATQARLPVPLCPELSFPCARGLQGKQSYPVETSPRSHLKPSSCERQVWGCSQHEGGCQQEADFGWVGGAGHPKRTGQQAP